MATKKKTAEEEAKLQSIALHDAEYERLISEYTEALQLLRSGEYATAQERFEKIDREKADERVIGDRARTYARICAQKLQPAAETPHTPQDCYQMAVMQCNGGDHDGAIRLLDQALHSEPNSPTLLYARASAWALKANVEAAVGDLRQAVTGDPTLRFQAVNDPDFEKIREEPTFIDIIEPTPAGV